MPPEFYFTITIQGWIAAETMDIAEERLEDWKPGDDVPFTLDSISVHMDEPVPDVPEPKYLDWS